jgi:hypothetical protein
MTPPLPNPTDARWMMGQDDLRPLLRRALEHDHRALLEAYEAANPGRWNNPLRSERRQIMEIPLEIAARHNQGALVRWLVAHGANPFYNTTATGPARGLLMACIESGERAVLDGLVETFPALRGLMGGAILLANETGLPSRESLARWVIDHRYFPDVSEGINPSVDPAAAFANTLVDWVQHGQVQTATGQDLGALCNSHPRMKAALQKAIDENWQLAGSDNDANSLFFMQEAGFEIDLTLVSPEDNPLILAVASRATVSGAFLVHHEAILHHARLQPSLFSEVVLHGMKVEWAGLYSAQRKTLRTYLDILERMDPGLVTAKNGQTPLVFSMVLTEPRPLHLVDTVATWMEDHAADAVDLLWSVDFDGMVFGAGLEDPISVLEADPANRDFCESVRTRLAPFLDKMALEAHIPEGVIETGPKPPRL